MNGPSVFAKVRNATSIPRGDVPEWDFGRFRRAVLAAVSGGARVAALFGDTGSGGGVELYAVVADDAASMLYVARTRVKDDDFHSLTPECPQIGRAHV